MSTFTLATQLGVGDHFSENWCGEVEEFVVTGRVEIDHCDAYTQVHWVATRAIDGIPLEFLIINGIEHYGPGIFIKE
jgi:hypothetical protein